jgi:hypothetical protein
VIRSLLTLGPLAVDKAGNLYTGDCDNALCNGTGRVVCRHPRVNATDAKG